MKDRFLRLSLALILTTISLYASVSTAQTIDGRVQTNFETNYTALINSDRFEGLTTLRVENNDNQDRNLTTELEGSGAVFQNGKAAQTFQLQPGTDKVFVVRFNSTESGYLNATTTDEDYGTLSSDSVRVNSRPTSLPQGRSVPGISWLHLVLIAGFATAYSLLL